MRPRTSTSPLRHHLSPTSPRRLVEVSTKAPRAAGRCYGPGRPPRTPQPTDHAATSRGGQSQRQGKQSDNGASKAKAKARPRPCEFGHWPPRGQGPSYPPGRPLSKPQPCARAATRQTPTCQPHFFKARLGVCRVPTKAPRAAGRQPPLQHRNQQPPTHVALAAHPADNRNETNHRWCAANRTRPHGPQDDNDQP